MYPLRRSRRPARGASWPKEGHVPVAQEQAARARGIVMTNGIERAACVGGGVIGSGWAARFVLSGIDVSMYDPDPETRRKVGEVLDNAERAYARLFGDERPAPGELRIADEHPRRHRRRRVHPGECARTARSEADGPCRDRFRRGARHRHRVVDFGAPAERHAARSCAPRADPGRAPVQSRLPAPSRRDRGRARHVRRDGRTSARGVRIHRHEAGGGQEGDRRVHRRPAPGGAVARGAVARARSVSPPSRRSTT